MNIFNYYKKSFIKTLNNEGYEFLNLEDKFLVEKPKKEGYGDITFNAALIFSSKLKSDPMDIALNFKTILKKNFKEFEVIEIYKPGFINFVFNKNFWLSFLKKINNEYGIPNINSQNILIEFVSANPTGPLHVGHCRGAVLGDVLSNLLVYTGNKVTKEYYVNDYGNQIDIFVESVYRRIIEIINNNPFPENSNLYPGQYIIDIAQNIIKKKIINNFDNYEAIKNNLSDLCIKEAMILIKQGLKSIGINHDSFIYETDIVKKDLINKAINKLSKNNYIYEGYLPQPKSVNEKNWVKRKQLLFKSTLFGDDEDRALKKFDGTWTYFANDIAYHDYKIERKFNKYINILGADHAGYLKRISSSVDALKKNVEFTCKVTQLVKLFKSGKPYKMSKRAGDFIELKDLVLAVGKDAVRFMMVYRNTDSQLDFDFDIVTDKSKDNPVFYVQYATARINSLFRKLKLNINEEILDVDLSLIKDKHEINIIKKISEWPHVIDLSSKNLEPHRIPYYLYELSSYFHTYWNMGKNNDSFKIIDNKNKELVKARIYLIKKIYFILEKGLNILNVAVLKEM